MRVYPRLLPAVLLLFFSGSDAPARALDYQEWALSRVHRPLRSHDPGILEFQDAVGVISDGAGGLYAVWIDTPTGREEVYGEHLDARGRRLWGGGGASAQLSARDTGRRLQVSLLPDGAGGALVAWLDLGSPGERAGAVVAQRYRPDGRALWKGARTVSGGDPAAAYLAAPARDGGAVFLLLRPQATALAGAAQRVDGGGRLLWGDGVPCLRLARPPGDAGLMQGTAAAYAGASAGSAVFLLPSVLLPGATAPAHVAVRIGPEAAPVPAPVVFSTGELPAGMVRAAGRGLAVWTKDRPPRRELYAAPLDAEGIPAAAAARALTEGERVEDVVPAPDGEGGAWVGWTSGLSPGPGMQSRLLRLQRDGGVAPGFEGGVLLMESSGNPPVLASVRDSVFAFFFVPLSVPRTLGPVRMQELRAGSGPRLLRGPRGVRVPFPGYGLPALQRQGDEIPIAALPGPAGVLLSVYAHFNELLVVPVPLAASPVLLERLRVAEVADDAITWEWDDHSTFFADFDAFEVYASTGGLLAVQDASTNTFRQGGLALGTTGQIRIVGRIGKAALEALSPPAVTTLAAPRPLPILVARSGSIDWVWERPAQPVEGFRVYSSSGPLLARLGPQATGYAQSGLADAATYQVRVEAFRGGFSSASWTEPVHLPLTAPPFVLAGGTGPVLWQWEPVSGALGYRIYASTGGLLAELGPRATTYLQAGLALGATAQVRLEAFSAGESTATPSQAVFLGLSAPESLVAWAAGPDRIRWGWNAVERSDGYRIYGADGQLLTRLGRGTTTYLQGGLAQGAAHQVRVEAYSGSLSSSAWSPALFLSAPAERSEKDAACMAGFRFERDAPGSWETAGLPSGRVKRLRDLWAEYQDCLSVAAGTAAGSARRLALFYDAVGGGDARAAKEQCKALLKSEAAAYLAEAADWDVLCERWASAFRKDEDPARACADAAARFLDPGIEEKEPVLALCRQALGWNPDLAKALRRRSPAACAAATPEWLCRALLEKGRPVCREAFEEKIRDATCAKD